MAKILLHWYKIMCPSCKELDNKYLLREDCIAGKVTCKCGYEGMVDLHYIGRAYKTIKDNYLLNPNIVDPT